LNQDAAGPMSYGWGSYDMASHTIVGNKVYAISGTAGAYQIWVEQYQARLDPTERFWKFHIANLDGTDTASYNFVPEEYGDKLFAYFDLATGEFIDREPAMDNWHLMATKYLDVYPGQPGLYAI